MPSVLWIEAEALPFPPAEVRSMLAPDIEHLTASAESIADGEPVDVAVIPADGADPLRAARAVHDRAPGADLIFTGSRKAGAALRTRLLLAPRIGRHWLIVDSPDAGATAEAIGRAVRAVRGRRQLRTTLDRMNVRLAKDEDPLRLRRMAISDRLLASLLKQAPDPILALDLDGRIETENRAAVAFFGRGLRGVQLPSLLDERGRARLEAAIAERADARIRSGVVREGAGVLELSITPVRGDDGQPMGFSVVARDVTSEQRAQRTAEFLQRSSEILFSSLNWAATIESAARAAVPFLGELCVIDVVQDGLLVRQTVASAVPELLGPGATLPGQAIDLHPDHP
ncbi:MAG TPA: PAS domain-containing protein, partial [Thermoanaerobaculia bacterium]|nr:PAS domain-containing protein [Thermoanaerobaculia bacterium]